MMCPDWNGLKMILTPRKSSVEIGDFRVETIPVAHDANEPIGVIVTCLADGARAGIMYDLGYVSASVLRAIDRLDVLVLEANHDEGMLRAGPYPFSVQMRIGGKFGHLSNRIAAQTASQCMHAGLNNVVLAHLSETCNDPKTALKTVGDSLRRARFKGRLTAASQDRVVGPFSAGSSSPAPKPVQLALGL
jgi:phosphoribosyl 1,2-cyclic phosphodiesterase